MCVWGGGGKVCMGGLGWSVGRVDVVRVKLARGGLSQGPTRLTTSGHVTHIPHVHTPTTAHLLWVPVFPADDIGGPNVARGAEPHAVLGHADLHCGQGGGETSSR